MKESWRKIRTQVTNSRLACDGPLNGGFGITPGYYRFLEPAGTFLPTSPPGLDVCGTAQVAWLRGNHPLPDEGTVVRDFCFQGTDGSCQRSLVGNVTTCEDSLGETFYVYGFSSLSSQVCYFGFCAVGA